MADVQELCRSAGVQDEMSLLKGELVHVDYVGLLGMRQEWLLVEECLSRYMVHTCTYGSSLMIPFKVPPQCVAAPPQCVAARFPLNVLQLFLLL